MRPFRHREAPTSSSRGPTSSSRAKRGDPWLLNAWTGDSQIAAEGSLPLRLILGAVAVNAMYQLIYQRILSRGHWRLVVLINLAMLAVVTPVALVAAPTYGIAAGGMAWAAGALVQLGRGLIWWFRTPAARSNT